MTDREKLIELLRVRYRESNPRDLIEYRLPNELVEKIADHLLANGVTIPTRCKDCKYKFSANGHNKDGCPLDGVGLMHDDDFCSCGDGKGEAND